MYIFDISEPLTLILLVFATILLVFLAHEIKKSAVAGGTLFAYLLLIIVYGVQYFTLSAELQEYKTTISLCITINLMLILLTFFAYLWVDDIEAKVTGKKSIDNSLDWFWKKV